MIDAEPRPGDVEFYVTGQFSFVFRDGELHHVEQEWDNGGHPYQGRIRGDDEHPDEETWLDDGTPEIARINDWINERIGIMANLPARDERLGTTLAPWEDDPRYPMAEWRMEVFNGDTQLGYADWRLHRIEQREAHSEPFLALPYEAEQCPECQVWIYIADGPFAENDPTKPMAGSLHYDQEHGELVSRRETPFGGVVLGHPWMHANEEPVEIDPTKQPREVDHE